MKISKALVQCNGNVTKISQLCSITENYDRHSISFTTVRHPITLHIFGKFDSFLAVLGRNHVYSAFTSAKMAPKPVYTNSAKHITGTKVSNR